ncbi:MAG: Biofilm associated protein A, partial [Pseudomonas fluorescens]|nr:Biofilm associated protein A [Pseudomonas fluorescens]
MNIAVVDGKTITQTQELRSTKQGEPVRIKAVRGGSYILAEGDKGVAPENITVKRVGKDLHVSLEGTDVDQPQLIIEDFYGSDSQLVGMAEDGAYHEYVSSDADLDHEAAFLIDGDSSAQVLGSDQLLGYGNGLTYGSGLMGAGMNFLPALLGLGGLALAGAAYAVGKNKDGGGHDDVIVPGGPSTPAIGGVHDSVGSVQGLIENGGSTDDTSPTFTGTGTPGNTVIIKDNGQVIGEVVIGTDGNWLFTPTTPLPEGAHSIVVTEKDPSGNVSAPSDGFDLIVDTFAPGKSVISGVIDDVGEIQGPVLSGGFTDDNRPTLTGIGESGVRIDVYANGEKIGETTVNTDGSWLFTPETALADGQHVFTTVAVDAAGNAGLPSSPHTITIDTIAPDTGVIGEVVDDAGLIIGNGGTTDDGTPTFSGGGLVPGDIVIIKDNDEIIGTAPVQEDGSWTWTPDTDLDEGDHSVIIVIRDPAGNESDPSDSLDFGVDLTAPVLPGDGSVGPGQAFEGAWDDVGPITGEINPGSGTDDGRPEF